MEWGQWFPFLRWNKAPPPLSLSLWLRLMTNFIFCTLFDGTIQKSEFSCKNHSLSGTQLTLIYIKSSPTSHDQTRWHTGSRTTIFLATTDLPVEISSWRRFFYFIHKIMSTSLIAFCNGSLFVIGRIWWSLDELFATCND